MILINVITNGDKKNLYLFCVRDELYNQNASLKIAKENNNSNNLNKNDIAAELKIISSTENISETDPEECMNLCKPNDNDENIRVDSIKKSGKCDIGYNSENIKNATSKSVLPKQDDTPEQCNYSVDADEIINSHIWCDYDCYKISQEDFYPSKVKDLNIQKLVITRFLNFYTGGRVPKGLHVSDLIFAVISITPITVDTEEFIWYENEYRDDGTLFFLTPEERLSAEYKVIVAKANSTKNKTLDEQKIKRNSINIKHKTEDVKNIADNVDFHTDNNEATSHKCAKQEKPLSSTEGDSVLTTSKSDIDIINMLSHVQKYLYGMSINWHGKVKHSGTESLEELLKLSPAENCAFNTSCNKLLQTWDECKNSRITLKYFFGFVALTLMRALVKSKKNLINTFKLKRYCDYLKPMHQSISYSQPHERCIDKCCKEFKTKERCQQIIFAKVLFNTLRLDCMRSKNLYTPSFGLYNIFRLCLVDHMAYYDMGILSLLKTIYRFCGQGKQFYIIVQELQSEEIDNCLQHVRTYISRYMVKNECTHCHTALWARFFDSKQFEYLSCHASYPLAVVLAVFVEKISKSSDIWRSAWVKSQEDDLDKCKELGSKLYDDYLVKCSQI